MVEELHRSNEVILSGIGARITAQFTALQLRGRSYTAGRPDAAKWKVYSSVDDTIFSISRGLELLI